MKQQTYIAGKDLALEETIEQARTLLESFDLPTEAVSWLNPAPHCWSVHVQSTICPQLYTNGKGITRDASLASGLGEFFERLSTNFFFADFYIGEIGENSPFYFYPDEKWFPATEVGGIPHHDGNGTPLLDDKLLRFYDPEGELRFEHLCDNNTEPQGNGICALPFSSLSTGVTTYFPVSLLNNLYVSNGMAAGNTAAESGSQAMSEIIERYVKNTIISQGICLPDVPTQILKNYPKIRAIISALNSGGLNVRVKDASLGGQFPVISVLLIDSKNGGVFAAFGANCRFETAIERTLTELLQGRDLHGFKDCQPPCHDLNLVDDPFNLESHFIDSDGLLSWNMFKDKADFKYTPWDFEGSTGKEFKTLQNIINRQGFDCYRAEYQHLGMYSCRIIVPGMSEIYPVDDLIWNNKVTGASLRPQLLNLPNLTNDELVSLFEMIEDLGLSDQQLLSYTIGILFDKDSSWASLRIGELKAMLLLATGKKDDALTWCTWALNYGELPSIRRRSYRLLIALLGFMLNGEELDSFKNGLQLFYSEKEIDEGLAIVAGKIKFHDLTFGANWSAISAEHTNLLHVYKRINAIKIQKVKAGSPI